MKLHMKLLVFFCVLYLLFVSCSCGSRINEPYECSVQYNKQHICSCAIIRGEFVLTADHCIREVRGRSIKDFKILLVGSGIYHNIEDYIPYLDNFSNHQCHEDIGLIKVQNSLYTESYNILDTYIPPHTPLNAYGYQENSHPMRNDLKTHCLFTLRNDDEGNLHLCTSDFYANGMSGGPIVDGNGRLVGILRGSGTGINNKKRPRECTVM
ncbi:trypsin epsilon-like isoform X2 [Contarinia nasturtii]|uniref:trypsin epsilon-like isoform X2 n=1 Tax=Contarinia nasturtii TaxID=265458 RepID=UPI0012D3E9DB|nr:trypsin epsilon-like isoform X2 [Contarinia nasturtii]